MKITRQFTFHAAHRMRGHSKGEQLHGHTYKVEITLKGTFDDLNPKFGYLRDFSEIEKVFEEKVFNKLDHKYLNDVKGLKYTTTEELAAWIFEKMYDHFKSTLNQVTVGATPISYATVTYADLKDYKKWKRK